MIITKRQKEILFAMKTQANILCYDIDVQRPYFNGKKIMYNTFDNLRRYRLIEHFGEDVRAKVRRYYRLTDEGRTQI